MERIVWALLECTRSGCIRSDGGVSSRLFSYGWMVPRKPLSKKGILAADSVVRAPIKEVAHLWARGIVRMESCKRVSLAALI
jgi:hypothetical protein